MQLDTIPSSETTTPLRQTANASAGERSSNGRRMNVPPASSETTEGLLHERDLLRRIASVRVVLTFANFAVIILDNSVPSAGTPMAYTRAFSAAFVFTIYATIFWILARRPQGISHRVALASPFLDVVFAALLIISTDGYLSPFHLWLVFAVVSAGFSQYRMLPFVTALLALCAHCLIALIPQEDPLDVSIFTVRAGYLFGVAAVLSSIGSFLTVQSFALSMIEDAGRKFAEVLSEREVIDLLVERLNRAIKLNRVEIELANGEKVEWGPNQGGHSAVIGLNIGRDLAQMRGYRKATLTRTEATMANVLCDRAATALRRIAAAKELARAAAVNERLRMTDELHDTSIQSLAALDFRLEAARAVAENLSSDLARDLSSIKGIARTVSSQIRDALTRRGEDHLIDADSIRRLVRQRWPLGAEVNIDRALRLSPLQWQVLDAMVKTGLGNARRHGAAKSVKLEIRLEREQVVRCTLENDGRPLPSPIEFGYGLRRLNEMTEEIEGSLRLESQGNHGARLILEFKSQT